MLWVTINRVVFFLSVKFLIIISAVFKSKEEVGSSKIIKFSDYKKPRRGVREIDLASYFKVGQTIANLTESERDLVNELLRRSLGKNPK